MGSCEDGDVHGDADGVRFVEPHPKVTLATQQQQNEDPDVHEAHAGCNAHTDTLISY